MEENAEFLKFMNDPSVEIINTTYLNDKVVYIQWRYVEEMNVDTTFINPILCAHVTAEASLYLHSFLEKLGEKVLYCDTDSIIFIEHPNDQKIETGPYLGQMGDKMDAYGSEAYTVKFISGRYNLF